MTLDDRIQAIFREHFDDPALVVADTTTAEDIPEWDSLAHVSLLFRIEEEFGVQFVGDEPASLADIGELKALLRAKGVG